MESVLYWAQLLLMPLYALSHFLPRDNRLWVFGSTFGRRFADNPRYFFLYVSRLAKKGSRIRPVWISHNREVVSFLRKNGYRAYYNHSLAGIVLSLRAGVYIYDNYSKDISFWLSGGAFKLNLWHGVGNKRINLDNLHDRVRNPQNLRERLTAIPRRISDEKPTDYVLCTSKEMGKYFAKAFGCSRSHVVCAGYPRCDALFEENRELLMEPLTQEERELRSRIAGFRKGDPSRRVIAYLPTFRDSEMKISEAMDFSIFDSWLQKKGYLFVVKLHPKSKIADILENLGGSRKNIILAPVDADVYTFLGEADMLVTDYSSVYTDYMLLSRPVVAFCYDSREYEENSRDYFIDQREYMPELVAEDMARLMQCIDRAFENDEMCEKRKAARARMFDRADGRACYRLYRWLLDRSTALPEAHMAKES